MFDPGFISVKARMPGRLQALKDLNDETREAFGEVLEDRIRERTPLSGVETPMLFTYMHRRFGLGNVGGDDYKDLGAGWLVTTPRDDLFLLVTPSFSGAYFSFAPYVWKTDGSGGLRETVRGDLLASMAEAYERTLLDLLRPVCQRDTDFNVLGEIDGEDNPAPEWTCGEDEDYEKLPRYHSSCGTPMPDGLFGGKDWQRMMGILQMNGEGDVENGLRNLVAAAEETALRNLHDADRSLYPLVAAGLRLADHQWAEKLIPSLSLDEAEEARTDEFTRIAYGHDLMAAPSSWALSLDGEKIGKAATLVTAFGVPTFRMKRGAKNVARAQLYAREWKRFSDLCGGEFDVDHVPDDEYPTDSTVSGFRRNVAEAGLDGISAWAEELASTDNGAAALWTVVARLWDLKKKSPMQEATTP